MFQSNNANSLITIIVPFYNGEPFLSACIESVLEQSYSHWELLLIDDGSSDHSAKVCEQYTSLDPRISYLRLPHGGVSIARNTGLRYGHGDYFFFLDCDDLIHPQTLEVELQLMQTFGCAFAGLVLSNVEEDFRLSESISPVIPEYRYFSSTELRTLFGYDRIYNLTAIGGKMLSRAVVSGLSFPESISSGEDTLFLLDVITRNEAPAVILTNALYFRRLHQSNTFYLQTFELKAHNLEAYLLLRTRYFELCGTPGRWEQLCVSNVFNWYVDTQTNLVSDRHADELRQKLVDLLCDDYARFLPVKRKCTARLYLFSPSLYWFAKKLYWRIHKLLTGKGESSPKYGKYGSLSGKT